MSHLRPRLAGAVAWAGALALLLGLCFGNPARAQELFVSSGNTDQVKRYNGVTGAFIDNFAAGGGLSVPNGLVFGSDGNLYVSSAGTNQVLRYNGTTGAFIDNFAPGVG